MTQHYTAAASAFQAFFKTHSTLLLQLDVLAFKPLESWHPDATGLQCLSSSVVCRTKVISMLSALHTCLAVTPPCSSAGHAWSLLSQIA